MKALNKVIVIGSLLIASFSGLAYGAPTSFAAQGFQVINKSSEDFQTSDPNACSGVTFPGPAQGKAPAGYLAANQTQVGPLTSISVAPNANVDACVTVYKSKTKSCTISLAVKDGKVVKESVGASGACSYDKYFTITINN
jgi:hypothetical protein